MIRRAALLSLIAFISAALAACSGPLDDGDGEEPSTPTAAGVPTSAVTATERPTVLAASTSTETLEADGTGTVSPTSTATSSPRATQAFTAAPSPTGAPLPTDGDELLIDGQPVALIIPGGDNGRTLYAATGEQLWRTNDGGLTWSEAGSGQHGPIIVALNEQNVLYSGDKGSCGRGESDFPFQRTSDAGRTWETVPANANIQPLLAYEAQGNAYLYGTDCGMQISRDGGDTWTRIVDLNGEEVFAVVTQRSDPMEQLLVVAATEGGTGRLFLFDLAAPDQPTFAGGLTQFWGDAAVDWRDGRIVLANAHQVGISDDTGMTWAWTREGLENATFAQDPLFEGIPLDLQEPFPGFRHARIDPTSRDRIWIGGNRGAYLSVDGGRTWTLIGEPEPVTGLALSTVTDRVFISYADGTRLWSLSNPQG